MSDLVPPPASPAAPDGRTADDVAGAALLLARAFEAGGTAWCVSPSWPHHARHVAVEFVHPVIVGKRALPAVAEAARGLDAVDRLRSNVRPGDAVIAIGPAHDTVLQEITRRASAWGVRVVWIGSGPRPAPGAADRVVWLDEPDAATSGRFVLQYHLLWELTHVCLEHPGTLIATDADCVDDVCITCSDEGQVAEVIDPRGDTALVRAGGRQETVQTLLVDPLAPHDLILVHAGTAIATIDPDRSVAP